MVVMKMLFSIWLPGGAPTQSSTISVILAVEIAAGGSDVNRVNSFRKDRAVTAALLNLDKLNPVTTRSNEGFPSAAGRIRGWCGRPWNHAALGRLENEFALLL
jgi:hypothetical protein